jgi:hypothetical protein
MPGGRCRGGRTDVGKRRPKWICPLCRRRRVPHPDATCFACQQRSPHLPRATTPRIRPPRTRTNRHEVAVNLAKLFVTRGVTPDLPRRWSGSRAGGRAVPGPAAAPAERRARRRWPQGTARSPPPRGRPRLPAPEASRTAGRRLIEDAGCHLLFLPPYSPDGQTWRHSRTKRRVSRAGMIRPCDANKAPGSERADGRQLPQGVPATPSSGA